MLVVEVIAGTPAVRYWGPRLPDDLALEELAVLAAPVIPLPGFVRELIGFEGR